METRSSLSGDFRDCLAQRKLLPCMGVEPRALGSKVLCPNHYTRAAPHKSAH